MDQSDSDSVSSTSERYNQEPADPMSLKENEEIEIEEIENNSHSVESLPTLNADFENLQCKKLGDLKVPYYEDKIKNLKNKYSQKRTQVKLLREECEKLKKKHQIPLTLTKRRLCHV